MAALIGAVVALTAGSPAGWALWGVGLVALALAFHVQRQIDPLRTL